VVRIGYLQGEYLPCGESAMLSEEAYGSLYDQSSIGVP